MSLHVDHYKFAGRGEGGAPLVLIHGWGMHGGMWRGVAELLVQHFDVYAVDLPGHGASAPLDTFTLDRVVEQLAAQFDEPLAVCGWSLGGLVALRWALQYPQQVERLVMVASTPCFVRLEDWKYALSVEILEEFATNLQKNYAMTLKRFLSLQMRGSELEREVLAVLRDGLFSRGEPDLAALQAGLEILRGSDQRAALPTLRQATLVLAGERDTLIPHQATQYLADRIPKGRLVTIKGAAHAPFLSHQEEFVEHMVSFLNEQKHG
jgi:pimeloyl-[acyl-carrier protein] methyl ester esterase